jgi:hypothetical protein
MSLAGRARDQAGFEQEHLEGHAGIPSEIGLCLPVATHNCTERSQDTDRFIPAPVDNVPSATRVDIATLWADDEQRSVGKVCNWTPPKTSARGA